MKLTRFLGRTDYQHGSTAKVGVVLVNLGTPDAPDAPSLRRYLGEFLSDRRVIEIPTLIWKIILHGAVLRTRPKKSAQAYARVWTKEGSPLMTNTAKLTDGVRKSLQQRYGDNVQVEFAMRYGQPAVADVLRELQNKGVERLLVIPLYPQYSGASTGSVADAVFDTLREWRWVPELRLASAYHDSPAYINAVAESIRTHWQEHGRGDKLLLSFHGMPKATLDAGDPYYCQCHKSARLIAEALELEENQWEMAFQSRFGAAEWLKPYVAKRFEELPSEGVKQLTVACPGFAADCLETLDEIAREGAEDFIAAGGQSLNYVPALNAQQIHIDMFVDSVIAQTSDWPEFQPG